MQYFVLLPLISVQKFDTEIKNDMSKNSADDGMMHSFKIQM